MLSILIPTYNFNIYELVKEVHSQATQCHIDFEILVYDDASNPEFDAINNSIIGFTHCTYKKLTHNIGRSSIRNLLAKNATYNNLLFIDAGTMPKSSDFISNYTTIRSKDVATGGMTHKEHVPEKHFKLRWIYTKKRERNFFNGKQQNALFHSSNFLIKKRVLLKFPFDESLKNYGYEDVLFYHRLKKNGVTIHIFDNPVTHLADDTYIEFIKKNEEALKNLHQLNIDQKLEKDSSKLYGLYVTLKRLKLDHIVGILFKIIKPILNYNLHSSYPSLKFFDIYRLGYLCTLKNKNA